jgi:MFS family permease
LTGSSQDGPGGEDGGTDGVLGSEVAWYVRLVSSLYIATFAVRVSFAMVFISFPVYLGEDLGYLEYALVLSTWPLVEMIAVLGLGAGIDRKGRKDTLVLSTLGAGVVLLGFTLSDSPLWVATVNGLMGLAAAGILVASMALMADYAPRGKRGREMGVFEFVHIFGWLAGFSIGGVLVEVFSDDLMWTFVFASALCLFSGFYARLNVAEPRVNRYTTDHLTWSHLLSVVRQRSVVLLVVPWFLIYLLISAAFTFVFKASFEELALTGYQLATLLGGGAVVILATFLLFGRLSDRVGRLPVMIIGAIGMASLMVVVGVMVVTAPGDTSEGAGSEHINSFIAPLAISAFFAGAFAPSALAALVDVSFQRRRGITMGLYIFAISLAMAVGPIIAGALIDSMGGLGLMVYLATCGALVLVLVLLRWRDIREPPAGTTE